MAKALREGGLYKRGEQFVDAEGEEVSKSEVRKATKAAKAGDEGAPATTPALVVTDLDEDFPGRAALLKAGITKQAQVDELDRDGLIALPGIGDATADEILALREG